MKRVLQCLPMLALAPLTHFLAFYLGGLGMIDSGTAMSVGTFGFLALVVAVGLVFGLIGPATSNFVPYFAWLGAVAAQLALVALLPSGAEAEVMGVAHRMKRELPIAQIRECANQLLEKYRAKTLVSAEKEKHQTELWSDPVFFVDSTELPPVIQGRFRWVQVRRVQAGPIEDIQVFFFIDWGRSIICDRRTSVSDSCMHSIDKGIHAYHRQRS